MMGYLIKKFPFFLDEQNQKLNFIIIFENP